MKYKPKPIEKLKSNLSQRKGKGLNSFDNFEDFHGWYNEQTRNVIIVDLKRKKYRKSL